MCSALMVVRATLMAYDGSGFEDSGPYLVMLGGALGMAAGFLKRAGKPCSEKDAATK